MTAERTIPTFDFRRVVGATALFLADNTHYTFRCAARKAAIRAPFSETRCRNDRNADKAAIGSKADARKYGATGR